MIFFLMIWSLNTLAFVCLASAMQKHQKQLLQAELSSKNTKLIAILGWALFIIAFAICVFNGPLSNMMSYFIGTLTFSALIVGLLISYIPNRLRIFVIFCLIVLVSSSLFSLL